jgi:hypothetical protein
MIEQSITTNILVPVPPSLEEFGLSEKIVEKLPKRWIELVDTFVLVVFIVGIPLIFAYNSNPKNAIENFFLVLTISFVPIIIFIGESKILNWIKNIILSAVSMFDSDFEAFFKYKKAWVIYEQKVIEYNISIAKREKEFWRSLSGIEFEKELGKLFSLMGYAVEFTPSTSDGGVDLRLRKEGKLIIVQCKAHNKRIPIGVARELHASMIDFHADDAIIACFEGVTKPVMDYIKMKSISILDLDDIIMLHKQYGNNIREN